jgi:hypothetical protein
MSALLLLLPLAVLPGGVEVRLIVLRQLVRGSLDLSQA